MAFTGVALRNGWGAVGFWPGARVVSIRAMPVDATGFPFDSYQRAIYICSQKTAYNVVAVNMSLGCECAPNEYQRSALENRIVQAHSNGLSVVAAAGNNGGPVDSPASEPGVFAVGASDKADGLCSFSNRGTGLDLIAPGCGLELGDPSTGDLWLDYQGGTSAASMMGSVALALVRSYRPDLDWQTAENLVTHAGRPSAAGPVVDVEALFRATGLGTLVDAAKARAPSRAAEAGPDSVNEPPGEAAGDTRASSTDGSYISHDTRTNSARRFPTPELGRVQRRGARLTISVRNRPSRARLVVMLQSRRNEFGYRTVAHAMHLTNAVSLRLPRHWPGGRFLVRYEFPPGVDKASPTIYKQLRA
jgi:hypothetical protein